uniref:Uncharacterized protein n=1 Tax=Chromera velia CCMP2878 TaxID=1169474 RepID=A0A0G4GLH3_9ALVE|eukprot:Cvel_22426.t1-p1 / transcript=Cvel_22426.t1 / gene=Cvel_22426 / organism=Chromera_velia_CCMP2878 / gene_product=hypothetical protein / transcript_product=hypothetical protein / location=Cvel_scaffold2202:393-2433(-) / protein_length=570 / sequence_SO=supercontig / SO=protein_coding / is_pseudo=false
MLRRLHCHRRDLPILGKALTGSCRSLRTSLPSLYTREDADLLRRHLKIVGEKKKKEGLLALRTDVASDEAGPWQPSFSHLAVALQSLETHRGGAKDKRALFLATTRALRRILLDLHPGAKETSDTRELNTLTKILNLYEKRWMCEASQEVLQIAETVLMREAIVNRVNAVGKLVLLHALVAVPSSDSGAKEEIYWKCLHRALEEGAGGREFSLIECRLAWRVLSRLATRQRKRDGAGVASPEVCSSALSQATVRTRAALERAEKLVGGKEVGASAAACLLTAAIAEAWGNLSSLTGGVSVRENSPPPSFSSPSGTASNSDNEIRQCLEIAGSRLMVLSSDFRFFPAQQTSTLFQVGLELLPSAVAEKALLSAQSFVGVLHELGRDWGPTQAAALVEGLAHQGVARDEVSLGLKNLMRLQSTRTWIDSGVWIRMLALCGQTHEQQQHMGGGVRSLASLQSMVCSFLERSAHSLVREATSLAHSVGLVEAPVTSQWVQILELSESSGTLRPVLVKRARESLAHMNPSGVCVGGGGGYRWGFFPFQLMLWRLHFSSLRGFLCLSASRSLYLAW